MTCIFCRIISGEVQSNIISDTKSSLAFMDAFPLTTGHTLVIPKRHVSRIQHMKDYEVSDLFGLAANLISRTDALGGSTLMAVHNGPEAGQEVPHVHIHLVPRSKKDGAGPIHSMFTKNVKTANTAPILQKLKGI